jgi:hypothetical protein
LKLSHEQVYLSSWLLPFIHVYQYRVSHSQTVLENVMTKEYYQWRTTCRSVQQHILLSIRKEQQLKTYLTLSIQLCVLYSNEPQKQPWWSIEFIPFSVGTHIDMLTVFHRQYGRWYWPWLISVRSCNNRLVSVYYCDQMHNVSMTIDIRYTVKKMGWRSSRESGSRIYNNSRALRSVRKSHSNLL